MWCWRSEEFASHNFKVKPYLLFFVFLDKISLWGSHWPVTCFVIRQVLDSYCASSPGITDLLKHNTLGGGCLGLLSMTKTKNLKIDYKLKKKVD